MGATGTGAEPVPSIPSEPWGGSGHLLRQQAHWDLALKTTAVERVLKILIQVKVQLLPQKIAQVKVQITI